MTLSAAIEFVKELKGLIPENSRVVVARKLFLAGSFVTLYEGAWNSDSNYRRFLELCELVQADSKPKYRHCNDTL